MMDPMTMAALAQMMQGQVSGMNQNFGSMGYGGAQGDWGGVLQGAGQMLGPFGFGVSALGGFLSGKKAKKKEKRLKRKIEQARKITESIHGRGMANQEAMARKATEQQLGGFDVARKEASRLGRDAKQRILDTEKQLGAKLSQGLTNAGLGSTTVGANLQRGLAADTSRGLGAVDEGLASRFGDLALGRSQVEAGGTQALADLGAERSNFDINNAQFWMPQHLSRLGQINGMQLGGGQMGGFGGSNMGGMGMGGGMNMDWLAKIFGLGGGSSTGSGVSLGPGSSWS